MRRQGILAVGLLGSATALCLLLSRYGGLSADEEGRRSFRQALQNAPRSEPVETEDGVRLKYFDATWEKVLRDLAESQDLTLIMDKAPPGRFAWRENKRYTLDSAIRLLNSELEPQGYRLLLQKSYLIVLNLDSARTEYSRPRLPADQALDHLSVREPSDRPAAASRGLNQAEKDEEAWAQPPLAPARRQPTNRRNDTDDVNERTSSFSRFSTPIRPASQSSQDFAEAGSAAEVQGQMLTQEVEVLHNRASDLARTIYVVFEKRAQLQREGLNGFPTFAVFDHAPDGLVNKTGTPLFRIGIDQENNQLVLEASATRLDHLRKLVEDLDRPAEAEADESVRIVENNQISAKTANQLNQQLNQLVAMADELPPARRASRPQPPMQNEPAQKSDPAINLRGDVNIQAMPDLDILILKGNEADVAKVQEIIERLEQMSVGSLASVHVLTLKNIDSEAMATLLTSVYEQLTEIRQRGGTNQKTAAFIPVVQPNAILIISSEIERESILALADELDKPLEPEFEFKVFPLKSAVASQVVTALTSFYEEREGLGTTIRAIADVRTNSVVVQGRPNELEEVSKLIERIDRDEPSSTVRMQVFKLKQAVASELSTTINTAIQAVINPPQQQAGQGGVGFGGANQGAQELRDNKSVALEFLTTAGGIQELIRSGILADVRVSSDARSNTLIVSAPEATMELMSALIFELDRAPDAVSEIKVFTLKNADAQQSVDLLTTLFENTNQEDQLGIQLAGTEGSSSSLIPLRFSADIRTNTVLAVGSGESLSVVEAILLRLDNDDTRQRLTTVVPLRNAPAELVAATLLDFLEQQQALQASSEDLISNIERIRQEILVSPDTNSNSLIISASPQYFSQISGIIEQLDAQPPEVVIQAMLVEVTLSSTDEFGIELGFQDPLLLDRSLTVTTDGNSSLIPGINFNNTAVSLGGGSGAGTNPGTVATQGLSNFSLGRSNTDLGFGGFVFSAQSDAVSILLRALASRRSVQILSRPQVRTTHNNEAYVTVGQLVPIVDGVNVTGATGAANPNIDQRQVGITLRVTPRITPDGIIAMSVFADKSSLSGDEVSIFQQATGGAVGQSINSPIINQAQAVTTVNVPNGQTIVIGGMITKSDSTLERKVPWLGDLPIVGKAFRYDGTTTSRTELLIFLTPRIVMSDLDSELIKQVESERLHFIESEVEELHGPLFSVPAPSTQYPETGGIGEGMILTPEMPIQQLLEPEVSQPRN